MKNLFFVIILSLIFPSVLLGEYLPMNLSELTCKSDGIYSVYCKSAVPEKRNNDIFTNLDFEVLDTIKGKSIDSLKLSLRGGTVGNESVLDPDMTPILSGDRYVLFTKGGRLYPQGIFYVTSSGVLSSLTRTDVPLFTAKGVPISRGAVVKVEDLSYSLRKWLSKKEVKKSGS